MSNAGSYLYGFTHRQYVPAPDLRGLGGAPVKVVPFGDLAAVVSPLPVQRLLPSRNNVEPHHRVVRQVSAQAALVPAAFGHISESEEELLTVLRGNYDEIRHEIIRLAHTCEMTVKLRWTVDNIFECLVRGNRELRELRDRVFADPDPSLGAKLQVGSLFEATLGRERERLGGVLLGALRSVTIDSIVNPPRDEKMACHAALLIERRHAQDFTQAVAQAATLFDANFTVDYSGPWPPYSFVSLRLQAPASSAA